MEAEYWRNKWSKGQIGFHQTQINKRLKAFWGNLQLAEDAVIFVPLCGKSQDMLWLHQQGHRVLGIELSEVATEAFFTENHLPYSISNQDGFTVFSGQDIAAGIELWAGDFFRLQPQHVAGCAAFYDRASLIAMNSDLRVRYTEQLATLLNTHVKGLLLTIAYDQSKMDGPPFSVTDNTVKQLLSGCFTIEELAHFTGPERLGNLAERGLETLEERVYLLNRTAE